MHENRNSSFCAQMDVALDVFAIDKGPMDFRVDLLSAGFFHFFLHPALKLVRLPVANHPYGQ